MNYTTKIITTKQAFQDLENEWQKLLELSATNQIFQTHAFLFSWWQEFHPEKLCIITLRDAENRLVAVAPLFSEETSEGVTMRLLGCINVSDYLDSLVQKQLQDELYPILLESLAGLTWRSLKWCSLPEESASRVWLKQFFVSERVVETQQDVCPQIILPKTWEIYLSELNRKQRHEIRRKTRRLQEREHRFEEIKNPTQQDIDDFIYLHKQSSQNKRDFWDNVHLGFFRQLLPEIGKKDWLRLYFLRVENERAATMLIFDYNNQFLLYNSGFYLDKYRELSVGSLLVTYTIKQAIAQKRQIYDFLRGDESYKFRYTKTSKPIFDVCVTRAAAN